MNKREKTQSYKSVNIPSFSENVIRSDKIEKGEITAPSEIIKDMAYKINYYSNSCGAHNCQCYDNERLIKAILIYLDKIDTQC